MQRQIEQLLREAWEVTSVAAKRFLQIDGTHWAAAFAFNAVFSLFPLIILFVTLAAFFVDRENAGQAIITYAEGYVPLDGAMRDRIFGSISKVIEARKEAGLVALPILFWSALQCFNTLVLVTNRAWGNQDYNWWRLPLRGLTLLGVTAAAVLLGMAAPALASIGQSWLLTADGLGSWVYTVWGFVVPFLVLFFSLALFYRLAPSRQTRFAEVWVAAACATLLLLATQRLFVVYIKHFATLSAVYGVFGGFMALMLWIYLTGCGFIFGACLCAALANRVDPDARQLELEPGTVRGQGGHVEAASESQASAIAEREARRSGGQKKLGGSRGVVRRKLEDTQA